MSNLFRIDGPLYKISTIVYDLLVMNFLWLLFSLPVFTVGASTTALFYVSRKIIQNHGESSIVRPFWNSFKANFKQATIIWLILLLIFFVLLTNIRNIYLMGHLSKFLIIIQFVVLFETLVVSIYTFPLLAWYQTGIFDCIKASFIIANKHFITTILCLAVYPGLYYLLIWKGFFLLIIIGIYSLWISYLLKDKFALYTNSADRQE